MGGEVRKIDSVPFTKMEEMLSRGEIDNSFREVLERGLNPKSVQSVRMRAILYLRQNKLDESKPLLDEVMRRTPDALAHKMMGDYYFLKTDYLNAKRHYEHGIDLHPTHGDIVHDYAVACFQLGETERGLEYMRRAVEIAPTRPDFRHHLSLFLCTLRQFDEGWKLMDARIDVPGICGNFPEPEKYWKGEDLSGKTIVLRREQGFGDTIQFARYASVLLSLGARKVYFFIQRDMMSWCKARFADDPRVVPWPDHAPPPLDFDYHVNIMSMPQHFPGQYFSPPERMGKITGEGVGFCWFGSPTHKNDMHRSIELKKWEPIFNCGIPEKFYCLAYGRFMEKPPFVHYLVDTCFDWQDTAEKMKQLRLIITVDTAIAHLAGDMGIPVWLLLPKICDFRWGLEGDRTPWYDSIRIYRQTKLWDWESVIERVAGDLKKLYGI